MFARWLYDFFRLPCIFFKFNYGNSISENNYYGSIK